jgi:hypothetical protein
LQPFAFCQGVSLCAYDDETPTPVKLL